jgi:large subunit ribosomal protein L30
VSTKTKRKAKPKTAPRKATKAKVTRKRVAPAKKLEKPSITEKIEKEIPRPEAKVFTLAVRLLGPVAVPKNIEKTLKSLRLGRRFNAIIVEENANIVGMLRQSKDYVTWGQVGAHDIAALLKERGELTGGTPVTDKFTKEAFGQQSVDKLAAALADGEIRLKSLWQKGVKPVFRLRPPSGGFMYNIKRPSGSQGELGYRDAGISHLVARMI